MPGNYPLELNLFISRRVQKVTSAVCGPFCPPPCPHPLCSGSFLQKSTNRCEEEDSPTSFSGLLTIIPKRDAVVAVVVTREQVQRDLPILGKVKSFSHEFTLFPRQSLPPPTRLVVKVSSASFLSSSKVISQSGPRGFRGYDFRSLFEQCGPRIGLESMGTRVPLGGGRSAERVNLTSCRD